MRMHRVTLLLVALGLLAACGGGGGSAPVVVASLEGLTISTGVLVPPFAPDRLSYTVGPALLPASVTVTPTISMSAGTLTVNGLPVASGTASTPVLLAMGSTRIEVVLTPSGGGTPRTYEIAVDRTSAELADLTLSVGALSPGFAASTLAYSVTTGVGTPSTTLSPTALDPNADIRVNTLAVANGVPSQPFALATPLTPITIVVTARDGVTTTTYAVGITRSLAGAEGYIKASNTSLNANFGLAVALSGDTLVATAPYDDLPGLGDCGGVYVFVRSGSTWAQQALLHASNAGGSDGLGRSVAISGDTLVVGAPGEASVATGVDGDATSNAAGSSGAAYVFVRSGTTWTQQAYLKASNTGGGDLFGWSVDIDGDTVVVGAPYEDCSTTGIDGDGTNNSAIDSGATYVFVRSGSVWSHQAYLKPFNTDSGDWFGWCVSVSGATVVAGAPNEASPGTGINSGLQSQNTSGQSGAAYVFQRTLGVWAQQAYVKATNTGGGNQFGYGLALDGETLVVGAWSEGSGSSGVNSNQDQSVGPKPDSGAAYVYTRSGSTWSPGAYLKASNTGSGDRFGHGIAISGDTLVVGAYEEASSATGVGGDQTSNGAGTSGAVYVFVGAGSSWSQVAYVKATNTDAVDVFGFRVAVSGDTIAAGAAAEDSNAIGVGGNQLSNSATDSGAVYVYR